VSYVNNTRVPVTRYQREHATRSQSSLCSRKTRQSVSSRQFSRPFSLPLSLSLSLSLCLCFCLSVHYSLPPFYFLSRSLCLSPSLSVPHVLSPSPECSLARTLCIIYTNNSSSVSTETSLPPPRPSHSLFFFFLPLRPSFLFSVSRLLLPLRGSPPESIQFFLLSR